MRCSSLSWWSVSDARNLRKEKPARRIFFRLVWRLLPVAATATLLTLLNRFDRTLNSLIALITHSDASISKQKCIFREWFALGESRERSGFFLAIRPKFIWKIVLHDGGRPEGSIVSAWRGCGHWKRMNMPQLCSLETVVGSSCCVVLWSNQITETKVANDSKICKLASTCMQGSQKLSE